MFELGVALVSGLIVAGLAALCLGAVVAFIAESSYVDEVNLDDD